MSTDGYYRRKNYVKSNKIRTLIENKRTVLTKNLVERVTYDVYYNAKSFCRKHDIELNVLQACYDWIELELCSNGKEN